MSREVFSRLIHLDEIPMAWSRTLIILFVILSCFVTQVLAVNIPLTLSAVVLSKSQCKFNTKNATIDFGLLDPGAPVDVAGSASFDFTCIGNAPIASYAITIDDGLGSIVLGTPRMQHATDTTAFLPYSLSITPTSGTMPKKSVEILTIDATLPGSSYATAPAGIFSDTITITLLP